MTIKNNIDALIQLLDNYLVKNRSVNFSDKSAEEKIPVMPGLIGAMEGAKFFIEVGVKSGELSSEDATALRERMKIPLQYLSFEVSMRMDSQKEMIIAYKEAVKEKLFLNYTHGDEKV